MKNEYKIVKKWDFFENKVAYSGYVKVKDHTPDETLWQWVAGGSSLEDIQAKIKIYDSVHEEFFVL